MLIKVSVTVTSVIALIIFGVLAIVHRQSNLPRQAAARVSVNTFAGALEAYNKDTGTYPLTAQGLEALRKAPHGVAGWNGPYLPQDIHNDPWGRPYYYKFPGDHGNKPDVASFGTDGKPGGAGTDADILSWKE
ncbi:MAG: type II secretion system major pseudopilin GspG [Candidatus Solibacter usitatus]|nr:type II secretion system major pseudopilin GspG [Candidatus Solibacter usitatus]